MDHRPGARRRIRWLPLAVASLLVAACGSGEDPGSASADATSTALAAARSTDALPADRPATRYDAARFATLATFGPGDYDTELLMKIGVGAWIDRQWTLPFTSHRAYWEAADAAIKAANPANTGGQDQVWETFWKQALTGQDQLRQRVAFALSQIFVISAVDSNVGNQPRALADWLDMLEARSQGTYRQLLEAVTLHPLMGLYLSHLRNQKADSSGRQPDQNYAREVMQLFSIGLVQLNPDGTPVLVNGKTVDTYGQDDIASLARVFTGWSWACPAAPANACFLNGSSGGVSDPDRYFKPMVAYPQYHSTEAKTFLGVTIPAQTTATADPMGDLKIALDTLANHPNTAPFISRQLIQRLVTSNPSPAYVQSVAAVFADNGSGVRGDLKAVVKAILTHPEASRSDDASGKVREPVLRLSAYLRAFPHSSDTGAYKVGNTDNPANSLGQTPLRSPSVFNFYRPGYVAPGTQSAAAGLVAPELQLANETSAAGFVNYMRDNLSAGVGQSVTTTINGTAVTRRDLQRDWSLEMQLAPRPAELVQSITDKLLYGRASADLRSTIQTAITKITIPALNAGGTNQAAIDSAKRNRIYATVLLTLASPEFLVQK